MPDKREQLANAGYGKAMEPFWKTKTLDEMTEQEWESLCDGCGRCCLVKLEEEDVGAIHFTDIGCTLLDGEACRCKDYDNRQSRVPDCVRLTPDAVRQLSWLPPSCAYRLVNEKKPLAAWHPLVSLRAESVHEAGISVRGRVHGPEENYDMGAMLKRIRVWPGQRPKPSPAKKEK
jgi:uncharacterized protein